jgi:hypothetical protein
MWLLILHSEEYCTYDVMRQNVMLGITENIYKYGLGTVSSISYEEAMFRAKATMFDEYWNKDVSWFLINTLEDGDFWE